MTETRTPVDCTYRPRLAGLDAVRVFAAVSVMVFHLGFWSWAAPSTAGTIVQGAVAYPALVPFAFWGRFGVETFFVVSGFVIAFTAASATPWRFVRSRVLRLVPAALVCATITLAVSTMIPSMREGLFARYVASVTFDPFGPWVDNVYWTLGIELSFYALTLAALAIRRLAWLEPAMIAIGLVSAAPSLLRALPFVHHALPMPALDARTHELLLLDHGAYFAIGVILWRGFFDRWTAWRIGALVLCTAGGALEIYYGVPAVLRAMTSTPRMLLAAIVWLLSVAVIAASICFDEAIRQRLGPRALRLIRLAGLSTYPLYLLHDVVGAAMLRALVVAGVQQYLALALACAGMAGLSVAVTAVAEPVLRAGLAAVLDRWPRARAEAASA